MLCTKCKKMIDEDSIYCKYCGKKQQATAAPKTLKRANGSGSVYKLSGRRRKPWAATVNKQLIGYYAEKSEAMKSLETITTNGTPEGFNETVSEVYEKWKEVHFRGLSEKGKEGYIAAWHRLEPIHNRKMRAIKVIDFQKIIDNAMTKSKDPEKVQPLSRSGKEKIKQLCSQLCKRAIQDDIINRNYGEFVKLDREEKKQKEVFSQEDISKLFKEDCETSRIVLALIYTGFRINELFGAKVSDVKLEYPENGAAGPPKISHIVGGEKTEAGKGRIVPISAKIKPFISEWLSLDREYLVCNSTGGKMDDKNFRNRQYYLLLERLVIPKKNPHCTRHTFASLMSTAGARPEDLQKIIGHANYSTTAEIYVHADISQLQDAIDRI